METHNHDIEMLHVELCRYIEEALKAQSANLGMIRTQDMNRFLSYIQRYEDFVGFVNGLPEVDSPETHPDIYKLEEYPPVERVENERINMMVRLLDMARKELANSASSRAPSGMLVFDSDRQLSYMAKIRTLLGLPVQPIDFPESSPRNASITDGRLGFKPA